MSKNKEPKNEEPKKPRTRRLSGWNLVDDRNWEERMAEIRANRPESTPPQTLKLPVMECDPDCPICHGDASYVDQQDITIQCPNAWQKVGG